MQILEGVEELKRPLSSSVVTIGNFDGIHRGHQKLLEKLKLHGRSLGAPSVVMTFDPHPMKVLFPEKSVFRLFSKKDQEEQLAKLGVDYLIRQAFNHELVQTSAEDFFQKYLLKPLTPKALVVGHDFRFGKNRQGDFNVLKKWGEAAGILVEQIEAFYLSGQVVSSSRIRDLLSKGDLFEVHQLLGRNYFIEGQVEGGHGRGKQMGFPTANLKAPEGVFMPKGVYVTQVHMGAESYKAVTNVGLSPTFEDLNPQLKIENFIFDLNKDIYDQNIRVEFFKYLRAEKKFSNVQELTEQISRDVSQAQEFWNGIR